MGIDDASRDDPAAKVPLQSEGRSGTDLWCLVGAYGGFRWGEVAGLTRANVDVRSSRVIVSTTAVEIGGTITLRNEPKTRRSKRSVPVA